MSETAAAEETTKSPHPSLAAFEEAIKAFDWTQFQGGHEKEERARKRFVISVTNLFIQARRYHNLEAIKIWNQHVKPPYHLIEEPKR